MNKLTEELKERIKHVEYSINDFEQDKELKVREKETFLELRNAQLKLLKEYLAFVNKVDLFERDLIILIRNLPIETKLNTKLRLIDKNVLFNKVEELKERIFNE